MYFRKGELALNEHIPLFLQIRHQNASCRLETVNPFPHIDAFWRLCSRQLFENSDKRRNCTKSAISPFATMFSTFCHRLSIQLWSFSKLWQNTFKVVCCRIVVWRKGLKSSAPDLLYAWKGYPFFLHVK